MKKTNLTILLVAVLMGMAANATFAQATALGADDGLKEKTGNAVGKRIAKVTKTPGDVTTTYEYDGQGRVVKNISGSVTTTYEYDGQGRVIDSGADRYVYGENIVIKKSHSADDEMYISFNVFEAGKVMESFEYDEFRRVFFSHATYSYDSDGYIAMMALDGSQAGQTDSLCITYHWVDGNCVFIKSAFTSKKDINEVDDDNWDVDSLTYTSILRPENFDIGYGGEPLPVSSKEALSKNLPLRITGKGYVREFDYIFEDGLLTKVVSTVTNFSNETTETATYQITWEDVPVAVER